MVYNVVIEEYQSFSFEEMAKRKGIYKIDGDDDEDCVFISLGEFVQHVIVVNKYTTNISIFSNKTPAYYSNTKFMEIKTKVTITFT